MMRYMPMIESGVSDLSQVFRADQVSTPLFKAVPVHLKESPLTAYERLVERRFDQAPVKWQNRYVGWVKTCELKSAPNVKGALRRLNQCTIMASYAPVSALLDVLSDEQFVFLAGPKGLEAFVTPSDLDRQPVRGHFYLLLAGVEMLLSDIVDAQVDGERVENAITGASLTRWHAARREDVETRPVEYLELEPLATMFAEVVADNPRWSKTFDDMLTRFCQLRPAIMHPTRPLMSGR